MKRILFGLSLILLTIQGGSAYIPPSISLGAAQYDWQTCVYLHRNRCVELRCSFVSQRDCQQSCLISAKQKCTVENENIQATPTFNVWDDE